MKRSTNTKSCIYKGLNINKNNNKIFFLIILYSYY